MFAAGSNDSHPDTLSAAITVSGLSIRDMVQQLHIKIGYHNGQGAGLAQRRQAHSTIERDPSPQLKRLGAAATLLGSDAASQRHP